MPNFMPDFIEYRPERLDLATTQAKATQFYETMSARRSVRDFSAEPVPRAVIEAVIAAASSAPSGANRQPWRFVAVSNSEVKKKIRVAAEQEEKLSHEGRMPLAWREAIAPLGVNWRKPFLETAPWLVIVFEETHSYDTDGEVQKNYYVKESVGIACGMFIAAIHQAGLATLTHTPSPMGFLAEVLERPANEKPFMLFPVGYPAHDATVPNITRKQLEEVAVWVE